MIRRTELKRLLFIGGAMLLAGCGVGNVHHLPLLVGQRDGKPLYSIDGYTGWGDKNPADARAFAERSAQAFCQDAPTLVRVDTTTASSPVAGGLRWTAIYTCQPK
jgi:hypothetical protein